MSISIRFLFALSLLFSLMFAANAVAESSKPASTFQQAMALFKQQRYDEALTYFRNAHDSGIERPKSAYYVALCYHQMGQIQAAHDAFKFVCQRYPNSTVGDQAFAHMKQLGATLAGQGSAPGAMDLGEPAGGLKKVDSNLGATKGANGLPSAGGASQSPKDADAPPGECVLKFTEEAMDGRMYVDGHINGKPVKMLFDTGSSVMYCRQSFLDKQRIDLNFRDKGRATGASGESATRVAQVRVAVGTIVKQETMYVEQDSPDSLYPYFDNCPIIGQSFLQDYIIEVDGPNKTIRLKPAEKARARMANKHRIPGAREVPFEREGDHIVVDVAINGREIKMIFDTGASQVVLADRQLPLAGLNRPVDAFNSVRRGAGGKRESYVFNIGHMKLGPVQQQEVEANVLMNSKIARPLLGQSFLSPLKYTIDPTRNVISFQ